jgi:hypothetical protein
MHEKTDVSLRGVAVGAGIILAGIVASFGGAWLVASHVDAAPTGASQGAPPQIAGAVLQTAPPQDLAAFRREKNARLETSGPVDEGHVHIPIERAMELVAKEKGR